VASAAGRLKQTGLLDGLDQAGIDPHALELLVVHQMAERSQNNQSRPGKTRVGFDDFGQRNTVHPGHVHVHDHDIEAVTGGVLQFFQRFLRAGGAGGPDTPGLHLVFQNAAIGVVIVHNQDVKIGQRNLIGLRGGFGRGRLFFKARREPEDGPLPRHAGETDLATHQLNELLGNG
jgi:hypothetical protein